MMEIVYTEVFENWLKRLRDLRAKVSILSRLERIDTLFRVLEALEVKLAVTR